MLKLLILQKKYLVALTQFGALLAIAVLAPLLHFQPVTGPIINAVLFLAAVYLGAQWALMLCLLPSLIALSTGLLPTVLAPMVPFIMTGNAILVIAFAIIKQKSFFTAVILASLLKFLFLFSTSYIVVNLIAKQPIAEKAAAMMSWPQLITALAGGAIAYCIIRVFRFN